jgi:hypothetical protein
MAGSEWLHTTPIQPIVSDFVLHIPNGPSSADELGTIAATFQSVFPAGQSKILDLNGAKLLLLGRSGTEEPMQVHSDACGAIVIKGLIFNSQSSQPVVEPAFLLREFVESGKLDRDRYEGTFVLAIWNARDGRALFANDHAALLHAYYGEFSSGFYASTWALPVARALRLQLNPDAVRDFLARGALMAPDTMFRGIKRLNIGEQLFASHGKTTVQRYWLPYAEPIYRTVAQASGVVGDLIVDRVRRYETLKQPLVCDLTAGYDSRLVVTACDHAKVNFAITVNGPSESLEVKISKKIATQQGWSIHWFNPRDYWTVPVDENLRRELLYRTDGNLVFPSIYHHLLSRPALAKIYQLHYIGGHGDFIRYFPFSHELFAIGRKRPANVARYMAYRFLQGGAPLPELFPEDWYPIFFNRLGRRIREVCTLLPNTLNTQQCDAVLLWKVTGHFSSYFSALWNWLPTTTPLGAAGFLNAAFATSYKAKLTSRLIRQVMHNLSPAVAAVETQYGGSGAPPSLATLHRELLQCGGRARYLFRKVGWAASRRLFPSRPPQWQANPARVPYLTEEFRAIMVPSEMRSRLLFQPDTLARLLQGSDEVWYQHEGLLLRVATLELLCRELDFQPDASFLTSTSEN